MVLEKTLESPLDCKEIQPVHPKGNQSWIFIGRTDAKAEVPILRPPDVKSRLTGKEPDAGKDWRKKEKEAVEDEMVGWHHQLNGYESEQTPGDGEGQGAWCAVVHGIAKIRAWLSYWTTTTPVLYDFRPQAMRPVGGQGWIRIPDPCHSCTRLALATLLPSIS